MRSRIVVLIVLCVALILTAGMLGTVKATGQETCCKAAGAAEGKACCGECGKVNKVFHEIQTTLRLSDCQMDTLKWILDRYGVGMEGKGMCQKCEEEREEAEGGGMCGMCRGEKEGLEGESEEEECAEMGTDKKIIELLEKISENTDKICQVLEKRQFRHGRHFRHGRSCEP